MEEEAFRCGAGMGTSTGARQSSLYGCHDGGEESEEDDDRGSLEEKKRVTGKRQETRVNLRLTFSRRPQLQ